jgi:hypothetical protein
MSGQMEATAAASWSQTSGAGTWTLRTSGESNGTAGGIQSFAAFRVLDGTETSPAFTCTASGRNQFTAIALAPDPGWKIGIDAWAATLIDTAAGTSHLPGSVTAAASGEVSVLLNHLTASAQGTTPVTTGGLAGWTSERSRSQAGSASTYSQYIQVAYKTGVSGTVSPPAETSSVSTVSVNYHVLVTETLTQVARSAPSVSAAVTSASSAAGPQDDGTASVTDPGTSSPAVT